MPCSDGTPMPSFGPSGSYTADLEEQIRDRNCEVCHGDGWVERS
jgi:hypothetical protein